MLDKDMCESQLVFTYAITYFKYMNTIVIHTYPYQAFVAPLILIAYLTNVEGFV